MKTLELVEGGCVFGMLRGAKRAAILHVKPYFFCGSTQWATSFRLHLASVGDKSVLGTHLRFCSESWFFGNRCRAAPDICSNPRRCQLASCTWLPVNGRIWWRKGESRRISVITSTRRVWAPEITSLTWNPHFWWIRRWCPSPAGSAASSAWGRGREWAWCFRRKRRQHTSTPWLCQQPAQLWTTP